VVNHAFGDAAQQEAFYRPVAPAADRDQVSVYFVGQLCYGLGGRVFPEVSFRHGPAGIFDPSRLLFEYLTGFLFERTADPALEMR
jgi:hypothetical protein